MRRIVRIKTNFLDYVSIFAKLLLRALLFLLTWWIPIKSNRIMFTNYFGKSGFGDNLKFIAEEFDRQQLDVDLYWGVGKNVDVSQFPNYIKVVHMWTWEWLKGLASSKIWIDNQRKHQYIYKKSNQIYIQTWHGGIALKKIELDALKYYNRPISYLAERKYDNKIADIYVSNSQFCTDMYRRAFDFKGEIWEIGYPRNDILIRSDFELKNSVRDFFSIPKDSIVVLYAPTFRSDMSIEAYDLDFENVANSISVKFGKEVHMIVRLHPNISHKVDETLLGRSNLYNGNLYSDSQELMLLADILITDFSNMMFEFSFQLKPCFLYSSDLEQYLKSQRSLYFEYNRLPYPQASNNNQLIKNIQQFDSSRYKQNVTEFLNDLNLFENGKSSEELVERIKTLINNKDGVI